MCSYFCTINRGHTGKACASHTSAPIVAAPSLIVLASLLLPVSEHMAVQMNSAVHATSPPVVQGDKDDREAPAVVKIGIEEEAAGGVDYADMAQWLRAAVLGVNWYPWRL